MQHNSKNYLIIVGMLAIFFVAGYVYIAYYISGLTAKTTALKGDIEVSQLKYFRLESLRKATENTSDQTQKITNLFVESGRAVDFISYIEELARTSSLTYSTKSIENTTSGNLADQNKDLLTITISTTGSWSSTMKFLKLIESLPYSVRIESADLVSNASTGSVSSRSVSDVTSATSSSEASPLPSSKWTLTVKFSVIEAK